ncbi:type II toxin-antitoxin system HipA family toxin [Planctomycetota bacterium]
MSSVAEVKLWGTTIGAVALADGETVATFQYDPVFLRSGIEVAPLTMPLSERVYQFPMLAQESFQGLPGLLSDSLPDRFGNALIDAWLSTQGRRRESFNAIERLCYTGKRGMGALEFEPVVGPSEQVTQPIQVDQLVALASAVLQARDGLQTSFAEGEKAGALQDILRVGTSAGGARAKALIAWHPETNEVRSGQIQAGDGFEYWLLKFDGVLANRDKELNDPQGYGVIEYAYHRMAVAAGITMQPCRLLKENGRRHFMTKRFDRLPNGDKLHMQSLGALAHFDFNQAGAYSYEQTLQVIRQIGLPMIDVEALYRRMVFNILARNQDDHVKNIAFLMDRRGQWSLAPAFDVIYSYQPTGQWTSTHQMTLNGKRDDFTWDDFQSWAKLASLKRGRAKVIFDEVHQVVQQWPELADEAGVLPAQRDKITATLRRV